MQHLPLLGILRAWEVSMNKTIQASPQQETKETNILLPHDASPWWYESGFTHLFAPARPHFVKVTLFHSSPDTLTTINGRVYCVLNNLCTTSPIWERAAFKKHNRWQSANQLAGIFCAFKLFFTDFPSFVHTLIASNHYNHLSFIMSLLQVSYFKISSCHSTVSVSEYKSWTRMNFINE